MQEDTTLLYAFGSSEYYLCVSETRPDLLSELSRAQEQMMVEEPNFVNSLKMKYDVVSRNLSDEEKAWLSRHQFLRVGYLNHYLPYSDTDKDGNVTGLVQALIPRILEELGVLHLDISYVGYNSYDDMIVDMNDGNIDVAFPVGGGLFFSEENGIYQSNPVASPGTDLIFSSKYYRHTLQTFAVNKNNRMQYYYVNTNYPDAMILYCDSIEGCLAAVADGNASYTTVNGFRANDLLKNRQFRELSLKPLNQPDYRAFGVRIGEEGLLRLLNRGVNLIGRDRIEAMAYRYIEGIYFPFLIRHDDGSSLDFRPSDCGSGPVGGGVFRTGILTRQATYGRKRRGQQSFGEKDCGAGRVPTGTD